MAVNIGPRIGIEGEAEYRKQINSIIQQTKTLSSQMKALTSSFDKNNKSLSDNAKQHKLLQDQIKAQQEKVRALNDMLQKSKEKFGENSEKTLKWKQAVADAETDLNRLQNELRTLPSNLDLVAQKMSAMGAKLETLGNTMMSVGRTMTTYVTGPIVAGFTAAVKTAGEFDQAMSKVQAIAGATAADMQSLRELALYMGKTTVFSAKEAAEGLTYMAMAGWKADQMIGGLPGIMNLAAASGEDLGTTSDIVTDALTAFGMKAEESAHFADVLAAAASNSNTNVSMLGESFKYAAPVAGALGYTVEDVAIGLGLMANAGIKADMAGTSLRNMFNRMAKPTKESAMAMERLGLELYDDEGKMYSFREIMDQLRDSMANIIVPLDEYEQQLDLLDQQLEDGTLTQKKYEAALEELNLQTFGAEGAEKARAAAMLGGTRAMSGLLAIANATTEDYEKLTKAIDESSQAFALLADGSVVPLNEALKSGQEVIREYNGSAEAMAAVMLNNLPGQLTLLKSALEGLAISIGDLLMPKMRVFVAQIQNLVDKFNALSDEEKMQIVKIGAIAAAVGPVLMVGGKLITVLGQFMQLAEPLATGIQAIAGSMGATSGSFLAALGPIAAVVAVIALLVAAFMTLWNTNEQFRTGMTATWEGIKASFSDFFASIEERLPAMQEAFTNFINIVKPLWEGFCNLLAPVFQGAFDAIKVILDGLLAAIIGVIDMLTGIFTLNKEMFMTGLQEFLTALITTFTEFWTVFWEMIVNMINVLLEYFGTSVQQIQMVILNAIANLLVGVKAKITELVTYVTTKIEEICNYIKSLPAKFYQWGVDMIQNLIDGIESMLGALEECVSNVAGAIASVLHFSEPDKGPLSNFHTWMPDMMKQLAGGIEAGRHQVQVAAANVAGDIATPLSAGATVTMNNNFTFSGGYTEADGEAIMRSINRKLGALYI